LIIKGLKEREKGLNESGFVFVSRFYGSQSNEKDCDVSDGSMV